VRNAGLSGRAGRDRTRANQTIYQGQAHAMATGNDIKAHEGTYGSFITLLKWSVPIIAVIALIIVILISN
jgi:hypothetical protein